MEISYSLQTKALQILQHFEQNKNLQDLQQKLNLLIPQETEGISKFSSKDLNNEEQIKFVYVDLMVQDIREQEFSYSYLIKKPISKQSQIVALKYGCNASAQNIEKAESGQYHIVMSSGDMLVCTTQFYQSKWIQEWNQQPDYSCSLTLITNGSHNFQLGKQIRAICVWNSNYQKLYFVRTVSQPQILENKMDFSLFCHKQKIQDYLIPKNSLLKNLNKFFSENYSFLVLFSLISEKSLFINGSDITLLAKQLLPRVCHLKVKAPFKQSLFPYKDQDNHLIRTSMQLSRQKTYLIVDFSEFGSEKQIKIQAEEIDNLKALKIFIEESNAVYRWQYGQSLFPHNHCGVIVKASNIFNPHFKYTQNPQQNIDINPFSNMDQQQKQLLRVYIQKCQSIDPKLDEANKQKIETLVKQELPKSKNFGIQIQNRMWLARLNAMSCGQSTLTVEDYLFACKLLKSQ